MPGSPLPRIALLTALFAFACGDVARKRFENAKGGAGAGGGARAGSNVGTGGKSAGAGGRVGGSGSGGKVGTGSTPSYGGEAGAGGAIGIDGSVGSGGGVCCHTNPTCDPGDVQLGGACPPDSSCYTVTACCNTILCLYSQCSVAPCLDGDSVLVDGACPPGRSCYLQAVCNAVFYCVSGGIPDAGGSGCGLPPPSGVHYFSTSLSECARRIGYVCPTGTTAYGDDCGCGCIQPQSCPDFVDCAAVIPPGPMDPLCNNPSMCPYTIRTL